MRLLRAVLLVFCFSSSLPAADLQSFFARYCLECHDNSTREGDFSIEALKAPDTHLNADEWLRVLQQVERRNMPPTDHLQPPSAERQAVILSLEKELADAEGKRLSEHTTRLRRLNRTEYRNTVRDLLHLNMQSFDPTREFPDDFRVHGFPTNGEKLVTSSFLLRQYLGAAEQIIERAVHFEPKPETQHWELLPPFDRTNHSFMHGERDYYKNVVQQPQPYQSIVERMYGIPKGGWCPVDDLRSGMPLSGWYNIRIQVEAKFRQANLDPTKTRHPLLWNADQSVRLQLCTGTLAGIDPDNSEALDYAATGIQAGQRDLAIWDLPDDQQVWLECRVWLDQGEFIRLGFPNGPSNSDYRLQDYFLDNKDTLLTKEQLEVMEKDSERAGAWNLTMWFESPRIRVFKIEIDGPLHESWPPESHRTIFGESAYSSGEATQVLQSFARQAWRRPVSADEITPFLKLVRAAENAGLETHLAIQEGLKAILCSPGFLYREEQNDILNQYELASRLSYFLWASMPDEQLLKRAAAAELCQAEVLHQEADRMLNDPRSDAFVEEFLDGWVGLRKLGAMAPDQGKFATYYDNDLEPSMRRETILFFKQMLRNNETVDRFLDSDQMLVNRDLADLYGIGLQLVEAARGQPVEGLTSEELIPDAEGDAPSLGFVQVPVHSTLRGGLLGQASVLTLTANGVDTSPVIRGIWILENLLGAPPAPPPPNIPVIEPDIRGATTIRTQLLKHRESAACSSCHNQIDPPGFALENFDAIGQWREQYIGRRKSQPIDASGEFGSTRFEDVSGFKQELLSRQDQFARCLVEKLLTFGLGRELTVADRPQIRQILNAASVNHYRLKDLVLLCAESECFRHK